VEAELTPEFDVLADIAYRLNKQPTCYGRRAFQRRRARATLAICRGGSHDMLDRARHGRRRDEFCAINTGV
jgi:hypothetical protein